MATPVMLSSSFASGGCSKRYRGMGFAADRRFAAFAALVVPGHNLGTTNRSARVVQASGNAIHGGS